MTDHKSPHPVTGLSVLVFNRFVFGWLFARRDGGTRNCEYSQRLITRGVACQCEICIFQEWCALVERPAERTGLRARGRTAALRPEATWTAACQKKPKNRKESTKKQSGYSGRTNVMPGENLNYCCSVSFSKAIFCHSDQNLNSFGGILVVTN